MLLIACVCLGVRRYLGILLYAPIVSAAPVLCNGLFNPQAGNATDGERRKGRRKERRKDLLEETCERERGAEGHKRSRYTHIFTYVLAHASVHTVFREHTHRSDVGAPGPILAHLWPSSR